ncbi:MAG: Type IV pilus assembly protein PilM [Candidatus Uhrbacteria bacterium GW2011_GWF2_41_16]|uniref:Type IV pilus assembly protein PilM n=2 Tax=Candidatus Uhriibacteriota TaxID=1752732 RepID=A0A0G0VBC5_9BACT|nr:MAG: Type IV pilus assembly protein PilM [Candidatus Uhrbacteria bacterium GW2011_GWA2_41_10]KKR86638.1 MAG: Type IV pilus assembly protein PilM [Candidatus Uhrbacteria bacterium GW2011_GWC2_41_11]KKR98218.1 MAG: Type IV pilus assembly protein PilM [Candidatus Uhrbacteria bacterium GW2011_GWF2_41_16]HBP00582.1 hypothetical protein [Candidatus Uhrbacteria bacterium]
MGWFGGSTKKSFLGVDIGSSGIKVVELLNEKGRARLLTYGYSERRPGDLTLPLLDDPKTAANLLVNVCKRAGTTSVKAVASLPLASVFSTLITVPREKDEKVIRETVQSQVRKLTPMPLEEMITYSTFIDPLKGSKMSDGTSIPVSNRSPNDSIKKKEYIRVLVTGTAKSLVQKYIETFKGAKLEIQALDTESFALIRSLVGKDKSTVMILDIGSLRTNMTIVEKGIPFLTRSINVGGAALTKKIMTQLGLSEEQAEQMKYDLGTLPPDALSLTEGIPAILESITHPILNEIRYAFDIYSRIELTDNKRVEKIILTGGSAHLPHLPEFLSQTLQMNVYRGDPWARVIFPPDLRAVLDEVGPRLAVAVGLAMREME